MWTTFQWTVADKEEVSEYNNDTEIAALELGNVETWRSYNNDDLFVEKK